MKKLFTLIGVALVAMSANAQNEQREIWDPNAEDIQALITTTLENPTIIEGDNFVSVPATSKVFPLGTRDACRDANDWSTVLTDAAAVKISMKSWIMETGTASVKLKVVSTPDTGDAEERATNGLQMGGNDGGQALKGVEGYPTFTKYLKAKNGIGGIAYLEFTELNSENNNTFRVYEQPWTPGCGKAPAKGLYFQFTPAKDGSLTAGIWINKNLNNKKFYVVDGATLQPIKDLKILGFRNNNTYEFKGEVGEGEEKPATCIEWKLNDDDMLIIEDENTNQAFFAYVTWQVKKDATYYVLSNSTIGLSGFFFDPATQGGQEDGIATIATEQKDAPIFNLAGQRVARGVKGLMIQNGKKFLVK